MIIYLFPESQVYAVRQCLSQTYEHIRLSHQDGRQPILLQVQYFKNLCHSDAYHCQDHMSELQLYRQFH